MAMGTRKQREKQEGIWIAHTELASAPGHPFYQRLNELLEGGAVRPVCRRALREVLYVSVWAAVADPRHLHPVAADRLFRGYRQRAWNRLAFGGFVGAAALCGD